MNNHTATILKRSVLIWALCFCIQTLSSAQDTPPKDQAYDIEVGDFTSCRGLVSVFVREDKNYTTVSIKTKVKNKDGEEEWIEVSSTVEGTDDKSKEKATEETKKKFVDKLFDFILGKNKKNNDGKEVMAGPNGEGDFNPHGKKKQGPIKISLDMGGTVLKKQYRNMRQFNQQFGRDLQRAVQAAPVKSQ